MVENGSCKEVGKKGYKKGVIEIIHLFYFIPICINEVGNLGESKEADSQWQNNVHLIPVHPKYRISIGDKKVHIFEVAKQENV